MTYRLPLRTRLIVLWRRLTRQAIPYRDTWTPYLAGISA